MSFSSLDPPQPLNLSVLYLIASLICFDSQQSRCVIKGKCQRVCAPPPLKKKKKKVVFDVTLMIIALHYTALYCLT